MRYQSVWLSRRKATMLSSRIFARCCDSADWLRPTGLDQRANRHLAGFRQFAEDHQPPLVAERAQDIGDFQGIGLEVAKFHRRRCRHQCLIKLGIAKLDISNIYVNSSFLQEFGPNAPFSSFTRTGHPGVLRPAHQHHQLSGGRPGDAPRRGHRSRARFRSARWHRRRAFGRSHSRRGEGREADDRVGAGDPCARGPSVGRALYQIQNRRADRHRRAHQGRATNLPAGVQRRRPADRRQRF